MNNKIDHIGRYFSSEIARTLDKWVRETIFDSEEAAQWAADHQDEAKQYCDDNGWELFVSHPYFTDSGTLIRRYELVKDNERVDIIKISIGNGSEVL